MSQGHIRVLERTPCYLPELLRQFRDSAFEVSNAQNFATLSEHAMAPRPTVIVMDLDFDPAGCLRWLERQLTKGKSAPIILAASVQFAAYEWVIRSLGVSSFRIGPIPGIELARMCKTMSGATDRAGALER